MDDTQEFTDRRLQVGVCPKCLHEVGELFEKRKADGIVRSVRLSRKKLQRLKNKEKYNIQYTAQDINKQNYKKKLLGGSMGLTEQSRRNLIWCR